MWDYEIIYDNTITPFTLTFIDTDSQNTEIYPGENWDEARFYRILGFRGCKNIKRSITIHEQIEYPSVMYIDEPVRWTISPPQYQIKYEFSIAIKYEYFIDTIKILAYTSES